MGCGCGNKRDPSAYADESTLHPASDTHLLLRPDSHNTAANTSSMNNLQPGALDNSTAEQTKCPECEDPKQKKHTLDCSHGLCLACAKLQLEAQLKRRQGNIEFFCKTCRAPKNLSIFLVQS